MHHAALVTQDLRPFLEALDASPDAVLVSDSRHRIVLWNNAIERLLGWRAAEVVGYSCGSVLRGHDAFGNRYCEEHCPVIQIANRGDAVRRFNLTLPTSDGRSVASEVTVLHLPMPAPLRFLLSHIFRPIDATTAALHPPEEHLPPQSLSEAARYATDARLRHLTHREIEILGMLASGLSTAQIAERLFISALTVRNHTQSILRKLELHSKAEAVAFAFRHHMF